MKYIDWYEENIDRFPPEFEMYVSALKTKLYTEVNSFSFLKLFVYLLFFKVSFWQVRTGGGVSLYFYGDNIGKSPNAKSINKKFIENYLPKDSSIFRVSDRFSLSVSLFRIVKSAFVYKRFVSTFKMPIYLKLVLSVAYVKYKDHLDSISPMLEKAQFVGVFCDAIGFENTVSRYSRTLGCTTYTLQHGQYRNLDDEVRSPDVEAINNFVCDKLLCWGPATVEELMSQGVSPERMLVIGKLTSKNISLEHVKEPKFDCDFGLALCGENSKYYNFDLIDFADSICKKYGNKYYIRFHPSNSKREYLKFSEYGREVEADEYYSLCEYSVLGLSGVFIEFLESGHPFYFYDNGHLPDVFRRSGRVIYNIESLSHNVAFKEMRLVKDYYDDSSARSTSLSKLFGESYVL